MIKHVIINEETEECEWDTFKGGHRCFRMVEFAIVDTTADFHEAHLCSEHITEAWKETTGSNEPKMLNLKPA